MNVMSGKGVDLEKDSFFEDFGADGSKLDNDFSLIELSGSYFKDGEFSDEAFLKQNQHYIDALETIRQLKHRLIRRTEIIDDIRKYYLRDIVTVKHIMRDLLSNTEREAIYKQYESVLPSLDLKKALVLHAPIKTELQIKLCNECGGHLEIISRDSDEVEMLKKVISEARERENRWRIKLATLDSEIENTARNKAEITKLHFDEKKFLYAEIKKLKDDAEQHKINMTTVLKNSKKIKEENESFKTANSSLFEAATKLETTEKELEIVKTNMQDATDKLSVVQANEKTIQKDYAAAKLTIHESKAQVEKLSQEIHYVKQENVSHALMVTKMQESVKQAEVALQTAESRAEEAKQEILALESKALDVALEHSAVIMEKEKHIDALRYEIQDFEKTQRKHRKETASLAEKVKKANLIIKKLKDIKANQELDLLDSAEEIQLYEEEINAMQQFIRDKISHKSFSDHLSGVDMPDVLQKLQSLVNDTERDESALEAQGTPALNPKAAEALERGGSMSTFRSEAPVAEPIASTTDNDATITTVDEVGDKQPVDKAHVEATPIGRHKRIRRTAGIRLKQQQEIVLKGVNDKDVVNLKRFSKAPRGNAVIASKRRKQRRRGADGAIDEEEGENDQSGDENEDDEEDEIPMTEEEILEAEIAEIQLDENEELFDLNDDDSLTSANNDAHGAATMKKSTKGNKDKKKKESTPSKAKTTSSSSSSVKKPKKSSVLREEVTPKSKGAKKTRIKDFSDTEGAASTTITKSSKLKKTKSKASLKGKLTDQSDAQVDDEEDTNDGEGEDEIVDAGEGDESEVENEEQRDQELEEESMVLEVAAKQSLSRKSSKKATKTTSSKDLKKAKSYRKAASKKDIAADGSADDLTAEGESDGETDRNTVVSEDPGEEIIEFYVKDHSRKPPPPKKKRAGSKSNRVKDDTTAAPKKRKVKKFTIIKKKLPGVIHTEQHDDVAEPPIQPEEVEESSEEEEEEYSEDEVYSSEDEDVESRGRSPRVPKQRVQPKRRRSIPRNFKLGDQIIAFANKYKDAYFNNTFAPLPNKKTHREAYLNRVNSDIENAVNPYERHYDLQGANFHVIPVMTSDGTKKHHGEATKKQTHVEKTVHLEDPPEDASIFELQLRDALLVCIAAYPTVTENQAYTFINGTADVIHNYCRMFSKSLESTWESLLINRKSLDFFLKMLIVMEGMISLTSESASNEDLAEICARIVPLAGSSLSTTITTQWQEECGISDDIILDLIPILNHETGEREQLKYNRFFDSDNQEIVLDKVNLCLDTIHKMSTYATDSTLKLNSYLVEVLKDWSKAKGVFFDLDARIESEREKLRKQLEIRMNALARDVTKINKLYENSLDKITKLEARMRELGHVEAELKTTLSKLEESEYVSDVKSAQIEELKAAAVTTESELAKALAIIAEHEGSMTHLSALLSKTQTVLDVANKRLETMEAELRKVTEERDHFEIQYNNLVEKEETRKRGQVSLSTQCDPAVASIAIQTEFLVPPMELHTVVANKLAGAGARKYPQVMSHTLEHGHGTGNHNFVEENIEGVKEMLGGRIHTMTNPNVLHPVQFGTGHLAHNIYNHGPLTNTVEYVNGQAKIFDVSSHFHRPNSGPGLLNPLLHPQSLSRPISTGRQEQLAHDHSTASSVSKFGVGVVHPDHLTTFLNNQQSHTPHSPQHSAKSLRQPARQGSADSMNNDFDFSFKTTPPVISYDQYHSNANYYSEEEMLAMTNNIRLNSQQSHKGGRHGSAERGDNFHPSSNAVGSESFNMFPHGLVSNAPPTNLYNNPNKRITSDLSVGSSNSSTSQTRAVRIPPIDIHYSEYGASHHMHSPEKYVLVKQPSNERILSSSTSARTPGTAASHLEIDMTLPVVKNSFGAITPLGVALPVNKLPGRGLIRVDSEYNDSDVDFNLSPSEKDRDKNSDSNSVNTRNQHSFSSGMGGGVGPDGFSKKGIGFSNNIDNKNSEIKNGIVYNYRASNAISTADKNSSPFKTESNKIHHSTTSSVKRNKDKHPSTERISLGIDIPAINRLQLIQKEQERLAAESITDGKTKRKKNSVTIPTGQQIMTDSVAPTPITRSVLGQGGLGVLSGVNSIKGSRSGTGLSVSRSLDVTRDIVDMEEPDGGTRVSSATIRNMQRDLLSR